MGNILRNFFKSMHKTVINRLIELFEDSFNEIDISVPLFEIEKMAFFVHSSMDSGKRYFHTSDHIFEISKFLCPLQTLAAIFHDVVYYQIDFGFPELAEKLLDKYVLLQGEKIIVREDIDKDIVINTCLKIFNIKTSETLSTYKGLNEFLSSLVAVEILRPYLSLEHLICIVVCIEGTIPFREIDKKGLSHFDYLELSLKNIRDELNIKYSDEKIIETVRRAVVLANKDVENFADENPAVFLDNTWSLMPETNAILRKEGVYTVKNYRNALLKMNNFIENIRPDSIFHTYKNIPEKKEYLNLQKRTQINIRMAKKYLHIKLLAIAIIESLSEVTGGDAPLSMFLGGFAKNDFRIERAEHYLPDIDMVIGKNYNKELIKLLDIGRAKDSIFDMKNSPLALYIYKYYGNDLVEEYENHAFELFEKKISYEEFLNLFDRDLLSSIAFACSKIAVTRLDGLKRFFI